MNSCMKYHGGKYFLRKHIRPLIPSHDLYIEPCLGGGQIFFDKKPAPKEIINDINGDLMNMWKHIQCRPTSLYFCITAHRYHIDSFNWAITNSPSNNIERAAQTFIKYRQSLGGRGETFAHCSKNRLRRGIPDNESAYYTAIDLLPKNAKRLYGVKILSMDLIDAIRPHLQNPRAFVYIDPPYLAETRISPNIYKYEMDDAKHQELCRLINGATAQILVSGYDSLLYNTILDKWNRKEILIKNHSGSGKKKKSKTEVLWYNYGI